MNRFAAMVALGLTILVTGCEAKPDATKQALEKSAKVMADAEKTIKEVNEKTKEAVDKFKTSMEATKSVSAQTTNDATDASEGVSESAGEAPSRKSSGNGERRGWLNLDGTTTGD